MLAKFYTNLKIDKKRGTFPLFVATFLLIAIRFLYFGFKYFPQLDDYIQHHNYALLVEQMFAGDMGEFIKWIGLLGARPIAGILDITIWSWLWPCSIVGVLLLSLMYAFAAVEFNKVFEKLFNTSNVFIVVFALLPLGMEGTYWMSASTRIIPGLVFVALSASYFVKFLESGAKKYLLLELLFQFLTFCFYEQTAVLSCALNILIAMLCCRDSGKRWLFSFGCFACAGLYFLVTRIQADSMLYASRANTILPTSSYYFDVFLPDLLSQIKSAFLGGGFYTFAYGLIRGIMRIFSDGALLYCLILIAVCVFFGYIVFSKGKGKERGEIVIPFIIGLILTIAPLAPFFILANPWFSFRGTVTSFVGIALVFDALIRLVTNNKHTAIAIIGSSIAFIFSICSVSELGDYRDTYLADQRVVSAVSTIASEIRKETDESCKVAIFNVDKRYVMELNSYFHEHIHGVTESDWALTGAVRCYNVNAYERITYVPISLRDDPTYKAWEYSTKNIGSMHAVYVYDENTNTVERLNVVPFSDAFELYYQDGEKYGTVFEHVSTDGNGKYGTFTEE